MGPDGLVPAGTSRPAPSSPRWSSKLLLLFLLLPFARMFSTAFFFFLVLKKSIFCCELAKPVLAARRELLTICSICQRDLGIFFSTGSYLGVWAPGCLTQGAVGPQESDGRNPRAKPCSLGGLNWPSCRAGRLGGIPNPSLWRC